MFPVKSIVPYYVTTSLYMDIFNNLEEDADEKDSVIQRLLLTESLMIE